MMDEEKNDFSLTTEIKTTVTWKDDIIVTESHKIFEKEIQTVANYMNESLPNVLLQAISAQRKVVF